MDAFEQLVSEILWAKGYWIRTSVKVKLTKEDKQQISLPTAPRWELDIVAYNGRDNILRVVECKSYLDSGGVRRQDFDGGDPRFKLFTKDPLRQVVFNRLRQQLAETGACRADAEVKLCLACGHIATEIHRERLRAHFTEKGWELWDESWLLEGLKEIAAESYENQVSSVVAKLFIRNGWTAPQSAKPTATVIPSVAAD